MKNIIQVKNLTKKYGKLIAVNDISFLVKKGEIFGLLGENGAGKTTTLEIIEGLRPATFGKVKILGIDVKKGYKNIKEKIGVQLQSSAYFNFLNLKEILDLFGSFYQQRLNSKQLLKMVGLKEKAKSYISNLSGGQRQRFSIIASLINDPEIVFLDEPTTGLDPLARRNLWQIISEIKKQGKTIVLTTHYMEEAEILCDRVAIMEQGKILTMGETHALVEKLKNPFKIMTTASQLTNPIKSEISQHSQIIPVPGKSHAYEIRCKFQKCLNKSITALEKINPESLTVGKATLEDVFIELTGKTISDEGE